ncbi:hypothetical protein AB1L88_15635 [Tautonia sp. JC769]|uniref:hypothetical protein n=1 Tax=Tautonia sp. JC769 TaxID=3232135 RepID=UPI00345A3135
MPTLHPAITPRFLRSIRQVVAIRASARADLDAASPDRRGSEWWGDRESEIAWCDRWLDHQADRLAIAVDELKALGGRSPSVN